MFKAGGATGVSWFVAAQPRQVLTLDGRMCSPWIFANAGAQGYYRTAYSSEALRALSYVGTKEDLPLIQQSTQFDGSAETSQLAAAAVKAIEAR